jgi:multisubunit Na+/H+ antiporter MnhC subunit
MFDFFNQSDILHSVITIGSFAIFGIGIAGFLLKKNLFKIFISLSIAEASLFIFFIGMHFDFDKKAPIIGGGIKEFSSQMVDPVPQAMILTTIVIAVAILALSLSFVMNYYRLTKNLDIDKMNELGDDK